MLSLLTFSTILNIFGYFICYTFSIYWNFGHLQSVFLFQFFFNTLKNFWHFQNSGLLRFFSNIFEHIFEILIIVNISRYFLHLHVIFIFDHSTHFKLSLFFLIYPTFKIIVNILDSFQHFRHLELSNSFAFFTFWYFGTLGVNAKTH